MSRTLKRMETAKGDPGFNFESLGLGQGTPWTEDVARLNKHRAKRRIRYSLAKASRRANRQGGKRA